jgi:NagD protein
LRREFAEAGFAVVEESAAEEPDAVVVGFDTALSYERLCLAGYWIERGKPFVATHLDRTCPTDRETLLVDCGAICKCLETATGRPPDAVLGKPRPSMLEGILKRHDLPPDRLAMVGDHLHTDIAMARASGTVSVLVLTGESTADDVRGCPDPPDIVVSDIGELGRLLRRAHENGG